MLRAEIVTGQPAMFERLLGGRSLRRVEPQERLDEVDSIRVNVLPVAGLAERKRECQCSS